MELNCLHEFLVLAETRNYLAAAEALFLSQPTLTRHIQSMEHELGAPLFVRTTHGTELTEFGRRFLPYARSIVQTQERCRAELLAGVRREKKIIVSFSGAMAPYNIGPYFARFKAENPDLELEIVHSALRLESLRTGACDFILYNEPDGLSEFNRVPLFSDDLVAVISRSHRLFGRKTISVSDLAGETLVMMDVHAAKDGPFMTACRAAGFTPPVSRTDGINMIDFASVNQYIPIMTRRPALYFADKSVSVLEISPAISFPADLIYRKAPPLSAAERRFLKFIRETPLECT